MSSYWITFLKTEITCIPRLLNKYAGEYYNNAAINGATWTFFLWCLAHCTSDSFFKAFFKRLGCKAYINKRLTQSLWSLAFYITILIFCGGILMKSEFIDNGYRISMSELKVNTSYDLNVFVGFLYLITFYVHTAVWEAFILENFLLGLNNLLLALVTLTAHYMRCIEAAFGLSVAISAAHIGIELARIVQLMTSYESKANRVFTKGFFILSVLFMLVVYAVALPISILLPLGLKTLQEPTTSVIIFITLCMVWLAVEVISSPIYRLAEHWIFHVNVEKRDELCPSCFAECALFLPRDDVVFTLKMYRQRMKEEEERMMSLRKPKNRNMFVQTLKCMVAIRRKIKQKRLSESSDSDASEDAQIREVRGAESESEEETESEGQVGRKDEGDGGVTITEILNDDETGDTEDVVDGKLQIRVRENKN